MPVPIMPIPDKQRDDRSTAMDYSFLAHFSPEKQSKKTVTASNRDAKLLFDIWCKAEKDGTNDTFKIIPEIATMRDIMRLKTMGFVKGTSDRVTFTDRGKIVISTMVMAEGSRFEKRRQEKTYTEILASMSKRGKKGYRIPKFAASTSNNLDLRKT